MEPGKRNGAADNIIAFWKSVPCVLIKSISFVVVMCAGLAAIVLFRLYRRCCDAVEYVRELGRHRRHHSHVHAPLVFVRPAMPDTVEMLGGDYGPVDTRVRGNLF